MVMFWLRSTQIAESSTVGGHERKRRSTWLLSLADLVTLLLAVTAVSLTAGRLEYLPHQSGGASSGDSGVGIVIAPSPDEVVSRTVFLFREQFSGEELELTAKAIKSLELPKNCSNSCNYLIEVMSCSPQSTGEQSAVWHETLLRLLTLHRQLFDGQEQVSGTVKMTSLGSQCGLLGYTGERKEQPVMAVRLREE